MDKPSLDLKHCHIPVVSLPSLTAEYPNFVILAKPAILRLICLFSLFTYLIDPPKLISKDSHCWLTIQARTCSFHHIPRWCFSIFRHRRMHQHPFTRHHKMLLSLMTIPAVVLWNFLPPWLQLLSTSQLATPRLRFRPSLLFIASQISNRTSFTSREFPTRHCQRRQQNIPVHI